MAFPLDSNSVGRRGPARIGATGCAERARQSVRALFFRGRDITGEFGREKAIQEQIAR